jgi:cobalt/nickel transport protein
MKNSSKLFLGILLVSLLVAGVASNFASSNPDGLEKVAQDIGFGESAKEAINADSLLANYGVKGIENTRLSTGAAGVVGVIATGAIASGLFFLIRRKAGEQK